ncbi:hypothetical protein GGR50DRAFT_352574 [Xylaria sp. CBS 124048]|nr:hypothetical protein GGR50DRAFT_352574 [Xylaria sp. CBS 124048]
MVVSFSSDALKGICSTDQLELLDAIDSLRLQGIDHFISLPQIIVCGDQSSGKSSVLEAISPFFEHVEAERGRNQRLRAVLQNLNTDFAMKLEQSGHKQTIVNSVPDDMEHTTDDKYKPKQVTRADFIEKVQDHMRRIRGRELPGHFNSVIVMDLFREQSAPWKQIVLDHMASVWAAVNRFLDLLVTSFSEESVCKHVLGKVISPALTILRQKIVDKAIELIDSQRFCHPVTYNRQFIEEIKRPSHINSHIHSLS